LAASIRPGWMPWRADWPLEVDDVRLIPGAAAAAARLATPAMCSCASPTSPPLAKGRVSLAQLCAVHARVTDLLVEEGVVLDASWLCVHHAHEVVPELSKPFTCRKPAPGMLLYAAKALDLDLCSSWMVGDTDADIFAGRTAGAGHC
jgi:D-glycero-D-manno-heptose 1,7-bisphosphate phosphatase